MLLLLLWRAALHAAAAAAAAADLLEPVPCRLWLTGQQLIIEQLLTQCGIHLQEGLWDDRLRNGMVDYVKGWNSGRSSTHGRDGGGGGGLLGGGWRERGEAWWKGMMV